MTALASLLAKLPGGSTVLECGAELQRRLEALAALIDKPQPSDPSNPDVVAYFDESHADYRCFWDLDASRSLHIGYWDSRTWTLRQALARQNEVLAKFGGLRRGERVFDAGCGVGGSAIFLAQKYKSPVIGVTLSRRQREKAAANAAAAGVDGVEFLCGDYGKTELPAESFDVVWALESTCYATDLGAFAREAHRLLKPGGRLLIADAYCTRAVYTVAERAALDKWLRSWAVPGIPSLEQASAAFRRAGFIQTRWADITRYVLPSARLLHAQAIAALPLGRVLHALGLRTEWQHRNLAGAYYQYEVCRRDLARYHMVCTYKPWEPIEEDAVRRPRKRRRREA